MYKIYFNETGISLLHTALMAEIKLIDPDALFVNYTGKTKLILSIMDKIKKNKALRQVYIFDTDVIRLKTDFFSLFKIIPAAGGLVLNNNSEMLMIYRRGSWDLPKGKMELGETKKQSAVREVMEETGLKNVQLIKKLCTTYHIYPVKSGRMILKPSYWYLMHSNDVDLSPQVEEDIEKVEWVTLTKYRAQNYLPIYANISQVINSYLFEYMGVV